jgi:dTDP-4-dehydrorhamnose reductase
MIAVLLEVDSRDELFGIFNYCNEGPTTWYDFAREIASILHLNADITPVSTAEYGAAAARPPYSVLDTTRLKKTYGIEIPHWKEGLKHVLDHL